MKKEYIIPALYIIDVDTMQMMAASLGESNVNTGEGYGPGDGAAAKEWNDGLLWKYDDNEEEQVDDGKWFR